MSRMVVAGMAMISGAAMAEVSGPPAPGAVESPAGQAMAGYAMRVAPSVAARPCPQPVDGEIVVCARTPGTVSPFRLPLPEERAAPGERQVLIGELPRAAAPGRLGAGPPVNFGVKLKLAF